MCAFVCRIALLLRCVRWSNKKVGGLPPTGMLSAHQVLEVRCFMVAMGRTATCDEGQLAIGSLLW